jgi:hypothetical protein
MGYVIIRQTLMDRLRNDVISLRALQAISPLRVVILDFQPSCPWAAGVFELQDDWDTLICIESDWDTSD